MKERSHETRRKYVLVGLFAFVGCLKSILAGKGIKTIYHHFHEFVEYKPVCVSNARSFLYLYLSVNFIDLVKTILNKEHFTSHIHHILSGGECLFCSVAFYYFSFSNTAPFPNFAYSWIFIRPTTWFT
jgi:hypothetical protein